MEDTIEYYRMTDKGIIAAQDYIIAEQRTELEELKHKAIEDALGEEFAIAGTCAAMMLIGWVGCKLMGYKPTLGQATVAAGFYAVVTLGVDVLHTVTKNAPASE